MATGLGPTVVVVGSVNMDLVVHVTAIPRPGETVLATGSSWSYGGKGANQAVAAAASGARTILVGAVGHDARGESLRRQLGTRGVDTAWLTRTGTESGLAVVSVAPNGDNAITVVPGANATLVAEHVVDALSGVDEQDVVVLQGEIPAATVELVLTLAFDRGGRAVLNLAPVVELSTAAIGLASVLVVNESEAEQLLARTGVPPLPGRDGLAAEALARVFTTSCVVTRGADGADVVAGPDALAVHVPAEPVHAVVDTTGAGDAFVGALSAALLAGDGLVRAAEAGARAGARAVQSTGAWLPEAGLASHGQPGHRSA